MTRLLLLGEDTRAKHPFVWGFVGTIWEGKEDPGGDLTQVNLLAPEVLLGLCGDNDEDDVVGDGFMEQLVVSLCLSHKNVELCQSLDGDGCREL